MTHVTEQQWIDYFGFQRFPFDRPEAGNEEFARPEFLANCFVEPSSFERIVGQADAPVTALLFADRGSGKTACRVMLDYYCQRGEIAHKQGQRVHVLSVPHTHLYEVLRLAQKDSPDLSDIRVRVEHHAAEILKRAVLSLAELLTTVPELSEQAKVLPSFDQQDMSWLIRGYRHYLSTTQRSLLYGGDRRSSIGFTGNKYYIERPLFESPASMEERFNTSPLEHIALWTRLMSKIGIPAMYVLVDGVDEFEATADDPETAFAILRPLVTCLQLMDSTPYLAFKFFLPSQLQSYIFQDDAIRRDRGFIIETIQWAEEDLIQILRRRLDALTHPEHRMRDRTQAGFDALCVPELRGQIELDLAHWANGNPRDLMLLCGLMAEAHCKNDVIGQDDPYQLNQSDWQAAVLRFEKRRVRSARTVEIDLSVNLRELIAQGESDRLEFKSSLRWDYSSNSSNKVLQQVVAKTVAGMLNSEGGILLIGVSDDGTALGIEKDLQTLSKQSLDGFQLATIDVIKTYLGIEYMAFVHISFLSDNDRSVCVVWVDKSSRPVFFKSGNTTEFCVRMGNSTRSLDVEASTLYVQTHWDN